jgi:hypothetical protein
MLGAVAKGRGDEIFASNVIEVHDDGDGWSVIQIPAQRKRGDGTFSMTIGKCDGSILAHYSR